jgi:hypothetical protein
LVRRSLLALDNSLRDPEQKNLKLQRLLAFSPNRRTYSLNALCLTNDMLLFSKLPNPQHH